MNMTAEQELKRMVIMQAFEWEEKDAPIMTADTIDFIYEELGKSEEMQDYICESYYELRTSGEATGLSCNWSRHYESEAVAAKSISGKWIGWTHWYGGGKHGEPEAIDWMGDAYFLDVKEEEKTVTVRTFTKGD